jgi:hypothetical protein
MVVSSGGCLILMLWFTVCLRSVQSYAAKTSDQPAGGDAHLATMLALEGSQIPEAVVGSMRQT